jgi:sialate O-acetylesterase
LKIRNSKFTTQDCAIKSAKQRDKGIPQESNMNRQFHKLVIGVFACILLSCAAQAEVTLPSLFSNGMVLQREMPVHVWGKAAPGERVSVTFRGETKSSSTDSLGYWSVYLLPGKAGGPYELAVRGANEIAIHDVLVGDVWIASGQSNMEFAMRQAANAEAEIAAASHPQIRLLRVRKSASEYPLYDAALDAGWAKCTPASVREFSAVAYYFAREVQQKENVPIGLIESSWGGTVAEAWTSMAALSDDPGLMPVFAARSRMMESSAICQLFWQTRSRRRSRPGPRAGRFRNSRGVRRIRCGLRRGCKTR